MRPHRMNIVWWHWLVLGFALVALEMAAAGGFYIIFFGVAALLIAALHGLGIAGPLWLQVLLFSVLGIGALLVFRGPLVRLIGEGPTDIDNLIGEIGTAIEDLGPGAIGRVELRGTTWTGRNTGGATLRSGHRCIVVARDRLTLIVTAEEAT